MEKIRTTLAAAALLALAACGGKSSSGTSPQDTTQGGDANAAAGAMSDASDPEFLRAGPLAVRNLVSDGGSADHPITSEHTDQNLKNAWGLDALPQSPWWVADNHTGVSTLYDGEGVAQPSTGPLVVKIPGPGPDPAAPTGLVANTTKAFSITMGGATGPAFFLFASEDGIISAWMRTTPVSTDAVKVIDESGSNAIFKGLALAASPAGARLYATDFHNGKVRVYDGSFAPVTLAAGAFTDGKIPAGYAPFGIRAFFDTVLLVTYAKQDDKAEDDAPGAGNGYVDAYATDGRLLARVASKGKLDSPWGLALAPPGFGRHGLRLLVGNFGDGHVVSFGLHRRDGRARGDQEGDLDDDGVYLRDAAGPIVIPGLWALSFGNGAAAGPASALFFTAGPNDEEDGLFGRIDPPAGG